MKSKVTPFIILILSLIATLSASSFASEPLSTRGYTISAGTAPKNLALATVQEVKDSVLTIKIYEVKHRIYVDDKTKITRSHQKASLSDIKTGMKVRISFVERAGKKIAKTVDIQPAPGQEKSEPKTVSPEKTDTDKAKTD